MIHTPGSIYQYEYPDECLQIASPILHVPQQEAKAIWQEIRQHLRSSSSSLLKHDIALFLLAEVTIQNNDNELEETLTACGKDAVIAGCSRILINLGKQQQDLVTALPLVLRTIRRYNLSTTVIIEDDEEGDKDMSAQMLLRLPALISNACHAQRMQLPSWAVRHNYLASLVQCSLERGESSQAMIRRMVQAGSSDAVSQGIWDYVHASKSEEDHVSQRLAQCCWAALITRRDQGKLVQSLFWHALQQQQPSTIHWKTQCETQLYTYLLQVCPPYYPSIARQCTKTLMLSKPTYGTPRLNRMLVHVLALLLEHQFPVADSSSSSDDSDDEGNSTLLELVTRDSVSTWSERRFVQQSPPPLQRRVTYFLRSSMPLLTQKTTSNLDVQLMRGIKVRLESSHVQVRADGMRIAELLAQQLGGTVHFGELEDEDEEEELIDKALEEEPLTQEEKRVQRRRRRYRDPDAEYESSDSEEEDAAKGDDDSLEWDEELVPLDQSDDDEEDLLETPKPLYLRDCLDLLMTPESNPLAASRHETSLQQLAPLVRSRPLDLPDVAVPLAEQLFRMDDKFGMNDFDIIVRGGLTALAVAEPVSIGDIILHNVIFEDFSLRRRMLGLFTLENAAKELCGANELLKGRLQDRLLKDEDRVSGTKRLVPNDGKTTRRWGRLNHPNRDPTTVVNRFAVVAPRWFYSLVGTFMERKDDVKLWGGANGARLLSHLLVTLATFVECSGNHSGNGSMTMARDLSEFAWTFRSAEDATIRSSVLVAVASSLAMVDEATMVEMLHGARLPDFLSSTVQHDPDETNRRIARAISRNVLEALKESHMSPSMLS